jgi:transposase-like protein
MGMATTKPKLPTRKDFDARFPDDAACLEHLMRVRWGATHDCEKCQRAAKFYRIKARRSYECEHCGFQVYPTAGTPFENTRTSLKDWFFVMFLFTTSRNGVSAKEVQRTLGVTYKTAWRMCALIRKYMGYVDGDFQIGGPGGKTVEVDEAYVGGKDRIGQDDKKIVLGMVERGGDVVALHIDRATAQEMQPQVLKYVRGGTRLISDTAWALQGLKFDYEHHTVNHRAREYVRGDIHTNTIE